MKNLKPLAKLLLLCLASLTAACGQASETTQPSLNVSASPPAQLYVASVEVSPSELQVTALEETAALESVITYSDGTQQSDVRRYYMHVTKRVYGSLQWTSSDPSIALVTEKGLVLPLAPGEVSITCYTSDDRSSPSSTSSVTVLARSSSNDPMPSNSIEADALPENADAYADGVVNYVIGDQGGFNEEFLPEIVLGPPHGNGCCQGSFDVFSLGFGGEITLEFMDFLIFNGPGADFIVFENGFQIGNDPENVFSEPAYVAVSENGNDYNEFPCDLTAPRYPGCAGTQPTFANPDENTIDPRDPLSAGGNSFDLDDVGLQTARFLRIIDAGLATGPAGSNNGGFDLDAVVIIHGISP